MRWNYLFFHITLRTCGLARLEKDTGPVRSLTPGRRCPRPGPFHRLDSSPLGATATYDSQERSVHRRQCGGSSAAVARARSVSGEGYPERSEHEAISATRSAAS